MAPTSANFYPTPLPGGNVLVGFTGTHTWTGSFTGTSTIKGQLLQTATGQITYLAFITFTGRPRAAPAPSASSRPEAGRSPAPYLDEQ